MKTIIFVADFFSNQIMGGGELNNDELIDIIASKEYKVIKLNSARISDSFIDSHPDSFYIIANFVMIPPQILQKITTQCDYVIYEHDHKYLKNRNRNNRNMNNSNQENTLLYKIIEDKYSIYKITLWCVLLILLYIIVRRCLC